MVKIIDRRKQSLGGNNKRKTSQIKNIAVHYSGTKQGNSSSFENTWKQKWSTGGYHEVILLNGVVELNYSPNVVSNGVGGQNTRMYNICYVGDGLPNNLQMEALLKRVKYNMKRFSIDSKNVKGHREYEGQATLCPVLNMNSFRKKVGGGSGESNTNNSNSGNSSTNKTISQMANMIINNKNVPTGHKNRRKWLGVSENIYQEVRKEVNKRLGSFTNSKKTYNNNDIKQMANKIINTKGVPNGHEARRKWLGIDQSTYNKVRNDVNKILGGGSNNSKGSKTVNQMASEIINNPNVPTGHEKRRKWLGINKATYEKVRKEVNRRM